MMTTAGKMLMGLLLAVWCVLFLDIPGGLSQHIALETQFGNIGDRVAFTVRLDSVPNAVTSFGFDVIYDSRVLQYTGTFFPEEIGRSFEFFDANEPNTGQIRVGGFTTRNQLGVGSSGRIVTLEFTVIGPGNATLSLANLVDDFTEWPAQSGIFEGMASQPSSTSAESNTPRPSSTQGGSSLARVPGIPVGGSIPQLSSPPPAGGASQLRTDQSTEGITQPSGTQAVQKSAESGRSVGATVSPGQEPRSALTGGQSPASQARTPTASPKPLVAEKTGVGSESKEAVRQAKGTPETALAVRDTMSRQDTSTATGSDRGEPGGQYGASHTLSPVHAIFLGVALIGVIFTILLQGRELKLQRIELKLMRVELSHTVKMQDRIGREFRELVYHSLLAAKLNSLNALLQVQRDKINIDNLQKLSHANGSLKPLDASSEPMVTSLKEIEAYVSEIEKTLKKC